MEITELLLALRRVPVDTRSAGCVWCDAWDDCDKNGCAVLREARRQLGRLEHIMAMREEGE